MQLQRKAEYLGLESGTPISWDTDVSGKDFMCYAPVSTWFNIFEYCDSKIQMLWHSDWRTLHLPSSSPGWQSST